MLEFRSPTGGVLIAGSRKLFDFSLDVAASGDLIRRNYRDSGADECDSRRMLADRQKIDLSGPRKLSQHRPPRFSSPGLLPVGALIALPGCQPGRRKHMTKLVAPAHRSADITREISKLAVPDAHRLESVDVFCEPVFDPADLGLERAK